MVVWTPWLRDTVGSMCPDWGISSLSSANLLDLCDMHSQLNLFDLLRQRISDPRSGTLSVGTLSISQRFLCLTSRRQVGSVSFCFLRSPLRWCVADGADRRVQFDWSLVTFQGLVFTLLADVARYYCGSPILRRCCPFPF